MGQRSGSMPGCQVIALAVGVNAGLLLSVLEALNAGEAVPVRGTLVLARERTGRSVFVSGFARRRVSYIGGSGEHRAFGAPMNENCTLWTLRVAWFESVFFASFLCR